MPRRWLADWIEGRILPLRESDDATRRLRVIAWWSRLNRPELFLLNKLLTGEFRVGVSHTLVVRAVAQFAGLATSTVEHRLMGAWEPSAEAYSVLIGPEGLADDPSRPYPFCLWRRLSTGLSRRSTRKSTNWIAGSDGIRPSDSDRSARSSRYTSSSSGSRRSRRRRATGQGWQSVSRVFSVGVEIKPPRRRIPWPPSNACLSRVIPGSDPDLTLI